MKFFQWINSLFSTRYSVWVIFQEFPAANVICCVFDYSSASLADKYIAEKQKRSPGTTYYKLPYAIHKTKKDLDFVLHTHPEED